MSVSDHQKFKPRSTEMDEYMKDRLDELKTFHSFAKDNNIKYSITCGTALGFLTIGRYFPWDDDIDITYSKVSYNTIKDLYNFGEPVNNIWKDSNWSFKKIKLNDNEYYFARMGNKFKLIKDNFKDIQDIKKQCDLGGLDIFPEGVTGEITDFLFPVETIQFSGVETMFLSSRSYILELIKKYGDVKTWGRYLNDDECCIRNINAEKLIEKYKI